MSASPGRRSPYSQSRQMSERGADSKLLVVDVGNTQTHFGVFDAGSEQVAEDWRFATDRESTSDEIAALLANMLALRGLSFADLGGSGLAALIQTACTS